MDETLDPWALAPKVGLAVIEATAEVLSCLEEEARATLVRAGSRAWSGGVLPTPLPDGRKICILNPTHSNERNKITLMEEISHVRLGHEPTRVVCTGDEHGVQVRDFHKAQEEEAYGVGAAALLPWHSFFHLVNQGSTREEIAAHYGVTQDLVKYRINITGAFALHRARQRVAGSR